MATILLFLNIVLGWLGVDIALGPPETCRATVFGYHADRLAGGAPPALGRRVRPDDWLVAHRWRPRKTWVQVCHKDRCAIAPVLDRGPFARVALDGDAWYNAMTEWVMVGGRNNPRRAEKLVDELYGGRWSGCVDLTPPVATAINLKGHGNRRAGRVTVRSYQLRIHWRAEPPPVGVRAVP